MTAGMPFSVLASAPTRTADVGGWTDTWFAEYGLVCNVAVDRRAQVRLDVDPGGTPGVELVAHHTGERYLIDHGDPPGRDLLLESAVRFLTPPGAVRLEVLDSIEPGSGLGSSAAVAVALVAALGVARREQRSRAEVAELAHKVEIATDKQSGVQDHWAAAFGGVSRLAVDYPSAVREEVCIDRRTHAELDRRLHTVYFGQPHVSSDLHDAVIADLGSDDVWLGLDRIRDAAHLAALALGAGDLVAYGDALRANHEALPLLSDALVSADADSLARLAARHGARGWKVNGAGGRGGSMVVLGPRDDAADAALVAAIAEHQGWRLLDARIASHGVIAHRFDHEDPALGTLARDRGFGSRP